MIVTPMALECMIKMEAGHGYTLVWQQLTQNEKYCVEEACKKDNIKSSRINMLRFSEKLPYKFIEIPKGN